MTLEEAAQLSSIIFGEAFEGEDLSDFPLYEVRFNGCVFRNCIFDTNRFGGSHFINCRFTHCSFRDAEFKECTFYDAEGAKGSEWAFCDLSHTRFVKCDLGANKITKSKGFLLELTDCSAVEMHLDLEVHRRVVQRNVIGGIRCFKTKMQGSILRKCDWEESRFEQCDLREADFSHSRLTGVSFLNSSLNNASFDEAILNEATIAHAGIEGLDLNLTRSYDNLIVSRDQHDAILNNFSIRTAN
ncbi:pentapeptide repeat-containing protein (plasmid) [Sphingomonas paeninsulae]|uniref:Pentapeptide repeat-containing protein n=1 Tax=Sphingomonas paeninsulae TaxID=2319844 RepID=A0A494TCX4_SPHPE|nr:pentapeptide repeat-containing protein [Sphingomonas paeninsulae]AYJ85104.1 pentapeptide repeat-containing protein [Sphingomonas paeninsulae]